MPVPARQDLRTDLHILILAAGASSRMAPRDKLLEVVDGVPLLVRITRFAMATGAVVTVVLPPNKPLRYAALRKLPVKRVIAETAQDGMAHSLKTGLNEVPEGADVMLLLADLPEITTADLSRMIEVHAKNPGSILRATSACGEPGHPVIFPAALRKELMGLTGDHGARQVLQAYADQIVTVALPGRHANTDLDTPEDWDKWRKSRKID